jgi:ubiquinone/menaquinone biosynthesis C-methylase UbiE
MLIRTIEDLLAKPDVRVLDIGAGNAVAKNRRAGYTELADKYEQLMHRPGYFGLDVQPGSNVMLIGDAHALPVADASLDGIIMVSVIEHLHDPVRAVNQVARVLKKGGIFFSYAPFFHPYHASPHDYFRVTQEGYRSLLRDFSQVDMVSGGNYIAVVNDVLSHAFGGSRIGRGLARVFVEFPLSILFHTFDAKQSSDVAVGFAARAVK